MVVKIKLIIHQFDISCFVPCLRKTWWVHFPGRCKRLFSGTHGRRVRTTWPVGYCRCFAVILGLTALVLLIRFKMNSLWLMLGGGVLGIVYKLITG